MTQVNLTTHDAGQRAERNAHLTLAQIQYDLIGTELERTNGDDAAIRVERDFTWHDEHRYTLGV